MRSKAATLLLASAFMGAGCEFGETADESPPAAFVSLLASGELVGYSASGDEVGRVKLGGQLVSPVSGAYIAVIDERRVAVLDAEARPNRLALVDLEQWAVLRRSQLPSGSTFRNLAVGPRTGRFYVAGDRPTNQMTAFGSPANVAVLAVLGQDGEVIRTAVLRDPETTPGPVAPYDWSVYSIAVGEREDWIYVSYHGPNTSGADSIANRGGRLVRCDSSGEGGVGCLQPVHGRVEIHGGGILASTGTPPRLVALDADATLRDRWSSGFATSAHLMEFARVGNRAFGLESCPKLGGLTSIDLDGDEALVIAAPAPPGTTIPDGVCGERIAARSDGPLLAVAKTTDEQDFILFVDGNTGETRASKQVAAPAVDVAALG